MCKCSLLSCVPLLSTPWTVARQAPLSVEFSKQEYWGGLPFPSSGDLPDPGIEPKCSALHADSFTLSYQGSPIFVCVYVCVCVCVCDTIMEADENSGKKTGSGFQWVRIQLISLLETCTCSSIKLGQYLHQSILTVNTNCYFFIMKACLVHM